MRIDLKTDARAMPLSSTSWCADEFNQQNEEIMNAIMDAGLTPSSEDRRQLAKAIRAAAGTNYATKNLANTNMLSNCILSAPNGVVELTSGTAPVSITVKQGLTVLIPNGRNADGTLNSIEYTVAADILKSEGFNSNTKYIVLHDDGGVTCAYSYVIKAAAPQAPEYWGFWYNTTNNKTFQWWCAGEGEEWQWLEVRVVLIAAIETNGTTINSLTPMKTVRLLTEEDIFTMPREELGPELTTDPVTGLAYSNGTTYTADRPMQLHAYGTKSSGGASFSITVNGRITAGYYESSSGSAISLRITTDVSTGDTYSFTGCSYRQRRDKFLI